MILALKITQEVIKNKSFVNVSKRVGVNSNIEVNLRKQENE